MSRRTRIEDTSDSEEEMLGFDEEDLVRKTIPGEASSSEEELMGVFDSDLDDDELYDYPQYERPQEVERENSDALNFRAWGRNNRQFYSTDFIDNDLDEFYEGDEAEAAELEEQEAQLLQRKLVSELNEADFIVALKASERQTTENEKFEDIARDISSLTTREKLDLMQKESPEFFVLVQDLKSKLNEIDNVLIPVLNHFGNQPDMPAPVKFLKKKFLVLTNYCTNITFYLLLKAKRSPVENHPVLKSLYKYRRVMEEIQEIDEAMRPKIEKVLMDIRDCKNPALKRLSSSLKKKGLLYLIKKSREEQFRKEAAAFLAEEAARKAAKSAAAAAAKAGTSGVKDDKGGEENGNAEEGNSENKNPENGDAVKENPKDKGSKKLKRPITYQMAKNKGLMPKRNKLQRNPRVKHRNKYRKALIKRRGQVRHARKVIPVYGGEPSGIKANVTKSIKFK